MRQEHLDGVPVFRPDAHDRTAPLRAGLVFGVGRRDETLLGSGLTHLVEHLVMRRVGRTPADAGASVDLLTTEFAATGRPGTTAHFLYIVCEALADLPLEQLAAEAGVLRAEDDRLAPGVVADLLRTFYGGTGPGRVAGPGPACLDR